MLTRTKSAKPSTLPAESALYKKTTLESGVRVVSETIPYVRSVSIGLWINSGSRDESDDKNGISHFVEHMVFKGTKNRSIKNIAQSLESLGGYLNAFTTKEQTCYYARVLDKHTGKAMDVLADLVQNPTFPKGELEKEKSVVIEELRHAEDNPEDIIHDYLDRMLFPHHPLGNPVIGNEANVRSFTRDDLLHHLDRHYTPSDIVVSAAGNIGHGRLVEIVQHYLGTLPRSNGKSKRRILPARWKDVRTEYDRPIQQAHICLGTLGYGVRHKDRYPLILLNALLGEGMSSRLHQKIRERYGFAYTVYSYLNMMSDAGIFGAYIGTDKKHIERSIELIRKELNLLCAKPIARAELERTKSQIKGVMMLGLENMSGRMMRLGAGELYFGEYIPLDSVLKQIDDVTPDAVLETANALFGGEKFATVVLKPAGTS